LHFNRPNQFCSVDQGIYGHLTRRNLAAVAAERRDHAQAEQLWREVLAECPGDREAQAKLDGLIGKRLAWREARRDTWTTTWLVPGSRRRLVRAIGPDDFDPYARLAKAWVEAPRATVIVA
jgi:hypothetical protein